MPVPMKRAEEKKTIAKDPNGEGDWTRMRDGGGKSNK